MTGPAVRTRIRNLRRPLGTPCVVFVDDGRWNAFDQLSPLLRRAGVRTVRVSTDGRAGERVLSRLLFDRFLLIPGGSDASAVHEIFATENIVDVQFVETLGEMVRANLALVTPEVAEQVGRRLDMIDKLRASELFDRGGVCTPGAAAGTDVSPEEAARRFGFPLAVKGRVGCGGTQVDIVSDLASLAEAVARWGDRRDRFFYEQYVEGQKFNYAAVVGGEGIEQELAYRVTGWTHLGMATEVETIDDDQLAAFGRRALAIARCTGFADLDIIRDAQGRDWLIDFNPRAFGGSANFLAAGMDTSEGYLRVLGRRAEPPRCPRPRPGVSIDVFPTCLDETARSGGLRRTAGVFLREARPYLAWLGLRYWLSEALVTLYLVLRSRRAGGRPPPPRRGTVPG
jgi:hypothetical protein